MVELEKAGVPTVVILSNGFQHDADASAKAFGMGPIPRVEVPLVYNNITTEQAIEQNRSGSRRDHGIVDARDIWRRDRESGVA